MKYFNKYEQYVRELGGMTYNQFVHERCEGPNALVVGDVFIRNKVKNNLFYKIESVNYAKKRCLVDCFDKDGKFQFDGVVLGSELTDPKVFTNVTSSCGIEFDHIDPTPEDKILWDICM